MTGTASSRRNAILATGGGLLWIVVPAVSATGVHRLAAIVAIGAVMGVSFGLLELRFSHGDVFTSAGRVGSVLLGLGLGLLFVTAVASGIYVEGNIAATVVVGLPLVAGVLVAATGSVFLAVSLHRRSTLSPWTSLVLGCGLPIDVLLNTIGARFLPVGVSIYGVAWIALGYRLSDDSPLRSISDPQTKTNDRSGTPARGLAPGTIVAGTVGIVFTIVGIVGIVTGPGGLPLIGRTILPSGIHVGIGVFGIGAALVGNRAIRLYNPVVGVLLLAITVGWTVPAIREILGLTLTGQVLHLPLGLVLLATRPATTYIENSDGN